MSHRSRLYRKHFSSCGHRGFGQYCHRCADIKFRKQTIAAEPRFLRAQWLSTYEQDAVDLRNLPRSIVIKARQILEQLAQGTEYYKFQGKRLLGIDRDLIRIPVTRRYRLLIKAIGNNTFKALKVLSHEAYNTIAHRGL